jgi:lipopolysaccharide biosynthesis protein
MKVDFNSTLHPVQSQSSTQDRHEAIPASRRPVARALAYYLPQFHPIEENNDWWGEGFTEWTNVTRATALFRNHLQPRLPRDLGFYDLRVPETREHQARLARDAGIEGFCYWHYWFGNGHRILERPFDEVLRSGQPDFPFCLAWANQTWSGIWYGDAKRVLIEQTYPGLKDEEAHFHSVLPAFRDRRYVRLDGKPLFLVLDPGHLPDAAGFIRHWRRLASEHGLPGLHFTAMCNDMTKPCLQFFDTVTTHGPGDFLENGEQRRTINRIKRRLRRRDFGPALNRLSKRYLNLPTRFEYRDVVEQALKALPEGDRFHPCVMPGWDNTPRAGKRGVVFENATPDLFRRYLRKALQRVMHLPPEQRIVFLKAWNEWAEGNYLEPDQIHGRGFLDAVKAELLPEPPR